PCVLLPIFNAGTRRWPTAYRQTVGQQVRAPAMAGDERLQSTSRVEFAPGVSVARSDLRFTFSRSGGPGGQAVNKLSTRAELRVAVDAIEGVDDAAAARLRRLAGKRLNQSDEIVLHAETYRSQLDN